MCKIKNRTCFMTFKTIFSIVMLGNLNISIIRINSRSRSLLFMTRVAACWNWRVAKCGILPATGCVTRNTVSRTYRSMRGLPTVLRCAISVTRSALSRGRVVRISTSPASSDMTRFAIVTLSVRMTSLW